MAGHGDNSSSLLKEYVERIERVEAEKQDVAEDLKQLYCEVKANGFDNKIMRAVIKRRKLAREDRDETDYLIKTYESNIEGIKSENESEFDATIGDILA